MTFTLKDVFGVWIRSTFCKGQKELRKDLREAWPGVTCSHDDHIALYFFLTTRSPLWNPFSSVIEQNSMFCETKSVATQPLCLVLPYLVEYIRVNHGSSREQALTRRGKVLKVAIEEHLQKPLRDPGQHGLLAEDIERQKDVNKGIARDDPFL